MAIVDELDLLNIELLKMADTVINNLTLALEAFLDFNCKKNYSINDDITDAQERQIEELCLSIFLKERPYASDLRKVSGILKLVGDLERLGDHAEDILQFSLKLRNVDKHYIEDVNRIVEVALDMVHDSIDSYIKSDVHLAQTIIDEDNIIDNLYDDLIQKIIELDKNGLCDSAFTVYTTLVIKYIERIADHAVNIAEWVIYITNGVHKDRKIF